MPIRPIFAVLGILCLSFTVWAGQGFEVLQYNQKTIIDKLGVRYKTTTAEYYVSSEAGRITFSNYR
ncbi:MAG: hypothetical protein K2P92_03820, partial [Bdellovibrionaceae bacterium]|nr:hypothetical protein [Pseudobdellovibrionaceae bacterium]